MTTDNVEEEVEDQGLAAAVQSQDAASPLIKGQNPSFFNAVTMSGGYSEFVQDGVLYRKLERGRSGTK